MNNFILFEIDSDYCNYLRKFDNKVMLNKDNQNSNKRPYIGIVLEINNNKYFAPLTSPKDKHKKQMKKHSIDMILINNGTYGAINLNNMIPVKNMFLKVKKYKIDTNDTKEEKQYKILLANQLNWCNRKNIKLLIKNNAEKLYSMITGKKENIYIKNLKNRCCDYKKLENISKMIYDKIIAYTKNNTEKNQAIKMALQ